MLNQKEYISISLTDEILKLVHVRGSGDGPKVVNVAKADLKDSSEEEKIEIIKSTLGEFDLKKAEAVAVVPSASTITKNIEIPSTEPEEIKSIIDLQAGRHTPFSREEILIGYINIGVHSRNYTKILLIIINSQIVQSQLNIFEQSGLKVNKVFFAPEGKARFYGRVLKIAEGSKPLGIIDIGKNTTDFSIELNHTVIACRNIPIGMQNLLQDDADADKKLVSELVQSIDSYQGEDIGDMPDTYILTSDDAKIKELQPVLEEKLKANVKVLPYLDHIAASQPVMLKIVSEYNDDSFLDIIAPASAFDNLHVDLIPEEVKTQRGIEEKGRQVVKVGAFSLIMLLLVCGVFFTKIYFRSLYLNKLAEEYEQKKKVVTSLEQISTNTRIIKDYLHSRMISLKVMNELYTIVPDEIYLNDILLDENGSIRIQGVSETRSTAFAFITILENSELFKNAKMISSNAKKERGKDVSAFEISFKLESAPDSEEDEESEDKDKEEAPDKK